MGIKLFQSKPGLFLLLFSKCPGFFLRPSVGAVSREVKAPKLRDYEQNGADRAQYGTRLLENLSDSLQECLDRCYTGRYLGLCRQLFDAYPSMRKSGISAFETDSLTLVQRLSFTHLVELLALKDPLKRAFYEIERVSDDGYNKINIQRYKFHGEWNYNISPNEIAKVIS